MTRMREMPLMETASASFVDRELRQKEALHTVNMVARQTGRELPVTIIEDDQFGNEPGVYLLDTSLVEQGPIKDATFSFEERMLAGAADSAHAVIAGSLTLDHGKHRQSQTEIAAKCFEKRSLEERRSRAQREIDIMRDMKLRGELSLEPVAVALTTESMGRSIVLLTKFDEGLYTLDNNPWGRGPNQHNTDNAVSAAAALGRFNTYGYVHKDAKIKNVASQVGGKVAMIDFETSEKIDANDPQEAGQAAHTDFNYFLGSLIDKGFLTLKRDNNFQDNAPAIRDALTAVSESYLSAWVDAPEAVQMHVYDIVSQVSADAETTLLGRSATV